MDSFHRASVLLLLLFVAGSAEAMQADMVLSLPNPQNSDELPVTLSVGFSPNDTYFWGAVDYDDHVELIVWRTADKQILWRSAPILLDGNQGYRDCHPSWSADEKSVAVLIQSDAGERQLAILDSATGTIQQTVTLENVSGEIYELLCNPQAGMVYILSGRYEGPNWVHAIDLKTSGISFTIPNAEHSQGIADVAISPDGTTLALTGLALSGQPMNEKPVTLWSAQNGSFLSTLAHSSRNTVRVEFLKSRPALISLQQDKSIREWNVVDPGTPTHTRLYEGSLQLTDITYTSRFGMSDLGQLVLATVGDQIAIADIQPGKLSTKVLTQYTESAYYGAALSASGKYLITGGTSILIMSVAGLELEEPRFARTCSLGSTWRQITLGANDKRLFLSGFGYGYVEIQDFARRRLFDKYYIHLNTQAGKVYSRYRNATFGSNSMGIHTGAIADGGTNPSLLINEKRLIAEGWKECSMVELNELKRIVFWNEDQWALYDNRMMKLAGSQDRVYAPYGVIETGDSIFLTNSAGLIEINGDDGSLKERHSWSTPLKPLESTTDDQIILGVFEGERHLRKLWRLNRETMVIDTPVALLSNRCGNDVISVAVATNAPRMAVAVSARGDHFLQTYSMPDFVSEKSWRIDGEILDLELSSDGTSIYLLTSKGDSSHLSELSLKDAHE